MSELASPTADATLGHRAWLAYVVQELSGPAVVLHTQAIQLAAAAEGTLPAADATLTTRIVQRANDLSAQLETWRTADSNAWTDTDWKNHRHDIRSRVGYVISATEDLLEGNVPPAVKPHLDHVLTTATHLLGLISNVVQFNPKAEESGDGMHTVRNVLASLPEAVARAARRADQSEPANILLIDDNQYNRELVAGMLSGLGHTVESLPSAQDAIARLDAAELREIDLILCDLIMPGISGFEFLQWIKAHPTHWAIPLIMVSALFDDDGALACITAGAEDYLTRPIRKELLRARLAGCLEKKRLRDREQAYQSRIDRLVRAIFPPAAVAEWQETGGIKARRIDKLGVLFTDIAGFTAWCESRRNEPETVVEMLQGLIARFEDVAQKYGVQKIKTIGDAFMAVVGLEAETANPALQLVQCGREFIRVAAEHPAGWGVRVGIHVGPAVTGVLGQTQFTFDVWGHTVNAAARMESNGVVGKITLSAEAYRDVQHEVVGIKRTVAAKGLGSVTVYDVI